jgi:hypothetical protein
LGHIYAVETGFCEEVTTTCSNYPWSKRDQLEGTLYGETECERHVHIAENVDKKEWGTMVLDDHTRGEKLHQLLLDCAHFVRHYFSCRCI